MCDLSALKEKSLLQYVYQLLLHATCNTPLASVLSKGLWLAIVTSRVLFWSIKWLYFYNGSWFVNVSETEGPTSGFLPLPEREEGLRSMIIQKYRIRSILQATLSSGLALHPKWAIVCPRWMEQLHLFLAILLSIEGKAKQQSLYSGAPSGESPFQDVLICWAPVSEPDTWVMMNGNFFP